MFTGYTQETFEFFMAIRFNNNRPFFKANYDWYLNSVRQPSLDLADALSDTIEAIDPDLERRPYKTLSHINRDIRFAKDKSPYRDYIWICFKHTDGSKGKLPEFYFDISDEGSSFGMGFYRPNSALMRRLRARINARPSDAYDLYEPISRNFSLTDFNDRKIAIPEGTPEILRPLYGSNRFYLTKDIRDFDLLRSPDLADVLNNGFNSLKPLYRFICDPD